MISTKSLLTFFLPSFKEDMNGTKVVKYINLARPHFAMGRLSHRAICDLAV
jgi:hypothetical protein